MHRWKEGSSYSLLIDYPFIDEELYPDGDDGDDTPTCQGKEYVDSVLRYVKIKGSYVKIGNGNFSYVPPTDKVQASGGFHVGLHRGFLPRG